MNGHNFSNSTITATLAGVLLGLYNALDLDEFLNTVLLAAIGAVVSFAVSSLLNALTKKRKP